MILDLAGKVPPSSVDLGDGLVALGYSATVRHTVWAIVPASALDEPMEPGYAARLDAVLRARQFGTWQTIVAHPRLSQVSQDQQVRAIGALTWGNEDDKFLLAIDGAGEGGRNSLAHRIAEASRRPVLATEGVIGEPSITPSGDIFDAWLLATGPGGRLVPWLTFMTGGDPETSGLATPPPRWQQYVRGLPAPPAGWTLVELPSGVGLHRGQLSTAQYQQLLTQIDFDQARISVMASPEEVVAISEYIDQLTRAMARQSALDETASSASDPRDSSAVHLLTPGAPLTEEQIGMLLQRLNVRILVSRDRVAAPPPSSPRLHGAGAGLSSIWLAYADAFMYLPVDSIEQELDQVGPRVPGTSQFLLNYMILSHPRESWVPDDDDWRLDDLPNVVWIHPPTVDGEVRAQIVALPRDTRYADLVFGAPGAVPTPWEWDGLRRVITELPEPVRARLRISHYHLSQADLGELRTLLRTFSVTRRELVAPESDTATPSAGPPTVTAPAAGSSVPPSPSGRSDTASPIPPPSPLLTTTPAPGSSTRRAPSPASMVSVPDPAGGGAPGGPRTTADLLAVQRDDARIWARQTYLRQLYGNAIGRPSALDRAWDQYTTALNALNNLWHAVGNHPDAAGLDLIIAEHLVVDSAAVQLAGELTAHGVTAAPPTDLTPTGFATFVQVAGDIVNAYYEGVVNAANSGMLGGTGVDGAIHSANAPGHLLAYNQQLRNSTHRNGLPVGSAVAAPTSGRYANQGVRYVILTVGPVSNGDPRDLHAAYRRSLLLADALGLTSVVFPIVSAGQFGWDAHHSTAIARQVVTDTKLRNVREVAIISTPQLGTTNPLRPRASTSHGPAPAPPGPLPIVVVTAPLPKPRTGTTTVATPATTSSTTTATTTIAASTAATGAPAPTTAAISTGLTPTPPTARSPRTPSPPLPAGDERPDGDRDFDAVLQTLTLDTDENGAATPLPQRPPLTWLTDPAPWLSGPDGSYQRPAGAQTTPVHDLPLGLRAAMPGHHTRDQPMLDALLELVRSVPGQAALTRALLLEAIPELLTAAEPTRDLLTSIAIRYGLRIQLFRTDDTGIVSADEPAGLSTDPVRFLHHDARPTVTDRYALLHPDLPGLGRAYAPSTRRNTPTLSLPSGRRVELPQATWYHTGTPNQINRDRIAGYHLPQSRLNVFLGSPDTKVTRQLLDELRTDLDRIPATARRYLNLVVFGDRASLESQLRDVLLPSRPGQTYTTPIHGLGTSARAGSGGEAGMRVTWVPYAGAPPTPRPRDTDPTRHRPTTQRRRLNRPQRHPAPR